tara:strand:+ start:4322 stop:4423 length:102 start_codon:yes stop_codon:yes gene_type:complete
MSDLFVWLKEQPRNFVFTYGFLCFVMGAIVSSL